MIRTRLIAAALVLAGGTALGQDDRDQYCRVVHPNGSRPEVKVHLGVTRRFVQNRTLSCLGQERSANVA